MKAKNALIIAFFILIAVITVFGISESLEQESPNNMTKQADLSLIEDNPTREVIPPIPNSLAVDHQKVILGEKLFHDANLSADGTISCSSCHDLSMGGTDNKAVSTGIRNQLGELNSPTVFNAVFNFSQFWDGRAKTLEVQAIGPLFNDHEMGNTSWNRIINYLEQTKEYALLFNKIYSAPIDSNQVLDAIAEYEKTLITPNSRFDQYLKGDTHALNTIELEGYELFKSRGCISCHQGVNMGGNMYQKAGIFEDISPNEPNSAWVGRFAVTQLEEDRGAFKVPTLRNIALTAPYFHDGSAKNLTEAVNIMGQAQLGIELSNLEVQKITAFLKSLTGEYKKQPL